MHEYNEHSLTREACYLVCVFHIALRIEMQFRVCGLMCDLIVISIDMSNLVFGCASVSFHKYEWVRFICLCMEYETAVWLKTPLYLHL